MIIIIKINKNNRDTDIQMPTSYNNEEIRGHSDRPVITGAVLRPRLVALLHEEIAHAAQNRWDKLNGTKFCLLLLISGLYLLFGEKAIFIA